MIGLFMQRNVVKSEIVISLGEALPDIPQNGYKEDYMANTEVKSEILTIFCAPPAWPAFACSVQHSGTTLASLLIHEFILSLRRRSTKVG